MDEPDRKSILLAPIFLLAKTTIMENKPFVMSQRALTSHWRHHQPGVLSTSLTAALLLWSKPHNISHRGRQLKVSIFRLQTEIFVFRISIEVMKKCYWIINSDARLLHWSPDEKEAFEIVGGIRDLYRGGGWGRRAPASEGPQDRNRRRPLHHSGISKHAPRCGCIAAILDFVSLMLGSGFSVQRQAAEIKAEPCGDTCTSVQTKSLATCRKVIEDQIWGY